MHRTVVEDRAGSAPATAPSVHELLDRVRACVAEPAYAARVAAADVEGRMDLENMRLLRELGVTALPVSGTYGTAPVALMIEVMELLRSHDASAAVAVNMHWAGARAHWRGCLPSHAGTKPWQRSWQVRRPCAVPSRTRRRNWTPGGPGRAASWMATSSCATAGLASAR